MYLAQDLENRSAGTAERISRIVFEYLKRDKHATYSAVRIRTHNIRSCKREY